MMCLPPSVSSWLLLLLGCCAQATPARADHLSLPLRRTPAAAGAPRAGRRLWRRSAGEVGEVGDRRLYKEMASVTKEDDGVYFTTICIGGTQCFTVIVDTGSSTIAVPCKGCNCGSAHHYFASSDSKTVSDTGRTYSQCYGEGSCNRGKLLEDFICFGKDCPADEAVKHAFGCCSTFSYNFPIQNADGIVGISPSGRTLVKDLAVHHKLDENEFALCFGVNGGELTVGGFDESLVTFRSENASESGSNGGGRAGPAG